MQLLKQHLTQMMQSNPKVIKMPADIHLLTQKEQLDIIVFCNTRSYEVVVETDYHIHIVRKYIDDDATTDKWVGIFCAICAILSIICLYLSLSK